MVRLKRFGLIPFSEKISNSLVYRFCPEVISVNSNEASVLMKSCVQGDEQIKNWKKGSGEFLSSKASNY